MIIKCPECGHQVSDKAPVCPSCGVEIAGHIVRCSHCGELYLKEEPSCPNCHHTETDATESGSKSPAGVQEENGGKAGPIVVMPVAEDGASSRETSATAAPETGRGKEEAHGTADSSSAGSEADEQTVDADFIIDDAADEEAIAAAEAVQEAAAGETPQKHSHVSLAVSLLIAAITAAVLLFLYNQGADMSRANSEQEAYAQALGSDEPAVLRNYLAENPSAPKTHRDSVAARLKTLVAADHSRQDTDRELAAAMAGNSKAALQQFLSKHPDTEHRSEVEARIDEIDWAQAVEKNDENAYLGYKAQHAAGEKTAAVGAVRQLLQGMNSKSSEKIAGAVAPSLNFLGAGGATAKDIRRYMTDKLYQADVKTINWHLGSPAEITKDSNDDGAELHLKVPATLDIERKGGRSRRNYILSATVKDGKITRVNWNQI